MKRVLTLLLIACVLFSGCAENRDIIKIKEKSFAEQVNNIYNNADDYIGRTINIEGMFFCFIYEEGGKPYYWVLRYGPACCEDDKYVGFEIVWNDGLEHEYPEQEAWIEVTGVLEKYYEDDYGYIRLVLTDLNEKEERGAENVTE